MIQDVMQRKNGSIDSLLQDCTAVLQKVATYKLPVAMDRRLLWLSENKEELTEAERGELLALVDFAEERTLEKLQAKVILRRFSESFPELFDRLTAVHYCS